MTNSNRYSTEAVQPESVGSGRQRMERRLLKPKGDLPLPASVYKTVFMAFALLSAVPTAHAATQTFTPSASFSVQVPVGVTHVYAVVIGGGGGTAGFVATPPFNLGGRGGGGSTLAAVLLTTPGQFLTGSAGAGDPGATPVCPSSHGGDGWSDGGFTNCSNGGAAGGGGGSSTLLLNSIGYLQAAGGGGGQMGSGFGPGLNGGVASTLTTAADCAAVSPGGAGGPRPLVGNAFSGNGGGGGGGQIGGAGGLGSQPGDAGSASIGGTSCSRNTGGSFVGSAAFAAGVPITFSNVGPDGSVALSWPELVKAFVPTTIASGSTTVLTFTVTNPIPFAQAITFTDNLPSGLRVAATPGISGTCSNAVAATSAAAGGSSITVTGVTVPASGSCTVRVNVTNVPGQLNAACAATPAAFTNSSANISLLAGASTSTMVSSCVVVTPPPATFLVAKTASRGPANTALAFNFTMTGLSATSTTAAVTTDATGLGSNSSTGAANTFTATPGTTVTVTEVGPFPPGWTTGRTNDSVCTDNGAPGTGNPTGALPGITWSGNTVTLPGSLVKPGSILTCTTQNTRPSIRLTKAIVGTPPDSGLFNLQISGGNPTPLATNPATNVGNGGATADVGLDASSTVTLTETAGSGASLANYSTSMACTTFAGTPVVVNGSAGVYTITAPAASADAGSPTATTKQLACIATNTALPRIRIAKTSVGNGAVGLFGFTLTGVTNPTDSVTTATAGTQVTSATAHIGTLNTAATITENAPAAGTATAVSCTDANSASTGNTVPITSATTAVMIPAANMKAGANYTCSYTNTRRATNLSVVKTANPTNVQTGGTMTFTLTVNNGGPDTANGAILRDKPGAGLACTAAPTCTASGGASCPSALALTANAITSNTGVPIPVFPSGSQVVVTMACTATATGQ